MNNLFSFRQNFSDPGQGHESDAKAKPLPFGTAKYNDIELSWPVEGRHILATFDSNCIIVYQAYNSTIANYAAAHQTFNGCREFNESRMTWIKTNFLWMMYRSNWARKDLNQSNVLAISMTRDGFEEILKCASVNEKNSDVRLQWDPDHTPDGQKAGLRRAIQLGLRNNILQKFLHEWIIRIDNVTEFVVQQSQLVDDKRLDLLQVPAERIYSLQHNDALAKHIQLDHFNP